MLGDKGADEVERIRLLLQRMVARSQLTLRAIEREAGVSHNTLRGVLNGDATLTMRHLLLILRVLGQDWGQFFHRAFPVREAVARTAASVDQGEAAMARKLERALGRDAESGGRVRQGG